MGKIFFIIILIIAYIKIFIAISKFLNLNKPFNLFNSLIIPILTFEIITTIIYMISAKFIIISPTIIHFIGISIPILHFNIFSIFYILINVLLIITTIGLNDAFIPLYNFVLATHFIIGALFTIRL